jgi:hypothetical protein
MTKKLNHCQQIEVLYTLWEGFLSARFDNIANLDPKIAKITAIMFFESIIKPRLDELKETGQRMEDGNIRRKVCMENTRLSKNLTLEEYYQKEKPKMKKVMEEQKKHNSEKA